MEKVWKATFRRKLQMPMRSIVGNSSRFAAETNEEVLEKYLEGEELSPMRSYRGCAKAFRKVFLSGFVRVWFEKRRYGPFTQSD